MIPQSFSWWCYSNRGIEADDLLASAAKIGYRAVELIPEELWPRAEKHGLAIATTGGHGPIEKGLNRPEHADRIEKELLANIAKAKQWKIPILICFSGNRAPDLTDEQSYDSCAKTLARVLPAAADAGVTLTMELLNSKVDHIDYQCDHTLWGVELCKRINHPAFKLLYDIYHLQIMEGDIIRTIEAHHEHFAYYHTAGNPGRHEPDASQEINYPPIYQTIAKTGYKGYIAHEFVAKGHIIESLAAAYLACETAIKDVS